MANKKPLAATTGQKSNNPFSHFSHKIALSRTSHLIVFQTLDGLSRFLESILRFLYKHFPKNGTVRFLANSFQQTPPTYQKPQTINSLFSQIIKEYLYKFLCYKKLSVMTHLREACDKVRKMRFLCSHPSVQLLRLVTLNNSTRVDVFFPLASKSTILFTKYNCLSI